MERLIAVDTLFKASKQTDSGAFFVDSFPIVVNDDTTGDPIRNGSYCGGA